MTKYWDIYRWTIKSLTALAAIFTIGVIMSCKPTVPSEFISESEMEDLLYDYHLAEAMASQTKGDQNANVIAYRAAVLKKYGVSQEEFDTSMVYYMRHTVRLHKIYQRISERMDNEAQELGATGSMGGIIVSSANGDTADIWNGPRVLALIPNQPYNLYQFSLQADSSFRKGDGFIFSFRTNFIFQDGSRDGLAYLAMTYKNDSVATRNMHISSSSSYTLQLSDNDSLGIKEVKGFLLLGNGSMNGGSTTTLRLMSVTDLHLFRCHAKPKKDNKTPGTPQTESGSEKATPTIEEIEQNTPTPPSTSKLPPNMRQMPDDREFRVDKDTAKRKFK